jgi:hypothetical protein
VFDAIADRLDQICQNCGVLPICVSQLLRGGSGVKLQINYSRGAGISGPVVPFLSQLSLEDRLDDVEFDIGAIGDNKLPNLIFDVIQRTSIPFEFARLQGEVEYFGQLTRDGYRSKSSPIFKAVVGCFRTVYAILKKITRFEN